MNMWSTLVASLGQGQPVIMQPKKHVVVSQTMRNTCRATRAIRARAQREKMVDAILAVMDDGERLKTHDISVRIGYHKANGAVKNRLIAMQKDGLILKHTTINKFGLKCLMWEVATCL